MPRLGECAYLSGRGCRFAPANAFPYTPGGYFRLTGGFLTSGHEKRPAGIPAGRFSLSKNFEIDSVSGIIEETGVFSWKIGEKMHGMSQS